VAAFVHGCFWHAHGCALSKLPSIRQDFWRAKLQGNALRDRNAVSDLEAENWRVLTIWECALRGPQRLPLLVVLDLAEHFIRVSVNSSLTIACSTNIDSID
jgi:DNA mismatch endonuclease (patch repair protein)